MSSAGPESIDAALERLGALHPRKIDLSLGRIQRLLDALGNPEQSLPPVIHIAGTNGKGSTAAFLKAIAEASGLRVHLYTSPHLVRFNERIVLNGQTVDDERLKAAFDVIEETNAGEPITFFEVTTAVAFHLFSQTPGDLLILETGLGGRFDATNVIAEPAVTAITPISLDHKEFLGDRLDDIAREKAGIMKKNRPVVVGPQTEEVMAVLEARAHVLHAPFHEWGQDFRAFPEHGRMVYEEDSLLWDLPKPGLLGSHQIANAAVAVRMARLIGLEEDAACDGLPRAEWPARLQRLIEGPLAELAHHYQASVWLDGGHNAGAAEALAASLGEIEADDSRPLVLISAFSKNKDAQAFFSYFEGLAARVIAIEFASGRDGSQTPQQVADASRQAGIMAQTAAGLTEAVHDACQEYDHPRVLICGSLYLAGEVLALGTDHKPTATPG